MFRKVYKDKNKLGRMHNYGLKLGGGSTGSKIQKYATDCHGKIMDHNKG